MLEIERKFLVNFSFPIEQATLITSIQQGYLAVDAKTQSAVRVRMDAGKFTLTAKRSVLGLGSLSRQEAEIEITREQFDSLWDLTDNGRVSKTRYRIPIPPYEAEVDVFFDRLLGLAIVEVEFDTVEEAEVFVPPAWFGREVTQDPTFTNAWMARHGNPLSVEGRAT